MTEAQELLGAEERRRERIVASFRLVVFAALLATILSLPRTAAQFIPLFSAGLGYGALAMGGIWLAWENRFGRWLLLGFVSIEVLVVALLVVLLVPASGMAPIMVFSAPAMTVIFIILAHATMRYRPWLIIHAAGLFLVALFVGWIVLARGMDTGTSPMGSHARFHATVAYQIIPIVSIALTGVLLFFANRGSRHLLISNVQDRLRVARLSRFFAKPIAEKLAADPEQPLMQGERRRVAVLFVDIRGFTRLSEQEEPEAIGKLLVGFRERTARAVREEGGVIDKFIGDAVMAVFGLFDEAGGGSRAALTCAGKIDSEMHSWSARRWEEGLAKIEVGMGIHEGQAFVGVIGEAELLEFTVVGDTVNVAERLERMTRSLDAAIATSADVHGAGGAAMDSQRWSFRPQCEVPGRDQLVDVYFLPRQISDVGGRDVSKTGNSTEMITS